MIALLKQGNDRTGKGKLTALEVALEVTFRRDLRYPQGKHNRVHPADAAQGTDKESTDQTCAADLGAAQAGWP